jgi:hypothetical protein
LEFTVIFEGQESCGGSTSLTRTVKLHVVLLPAASVEVDVTVVVPTGNRLPEGGIVTRLVKEQLSVEPIE